MSTRYDEITKILGTDSAGTPTPKPAAEEQKQTSRRDELFSLLGASEPVAPATADTGASAMQSSPVLEKPKQETLQQTTPQSAKPSTSSGAYAPPSPQGGGMSAEQIQQGERTAPAETAQITQSQAQAELDRLKPVLEEAKQYENEMGRYRSGAGQDESLYLRALTRRDSLLKKYGYSSVDELNKAVMDYTLASGNDLSFMQKLDRAGYTMEEGLKNTVLSGDWWKKVLSGGAEQWAGSQLNAAGTTAGNIESIGKEGAGMVYENELRARNDWAKTLEEAKSGVIKMDAEGIKEIENIIAYYDNTLLPSLRSGVQAYETLAEDSAAAADEITAKGQQNTEKAKEGLGWGGQLAVDLLTQGTMIALDKATGAPNISMFTRGLGSGAQEARQDGSSAQKQIGYGAAVGTVEVLTNKLFDGLAGIYGKGAADDLVEATIAKLAKSRAGQASLRLLASGFNEGIEDILSDAINPLLRTIYSDKSIKEEYSGEQISQWLYDGLVGAIMGTGLTAVNPETYALNTGNTQTGVEQEKTGLQPTTEAQDDGASPQPTSPQSAPLTAPLTQGSQTPQSPTATAPLKGEPINVQQETQAQASEAADRLPKAELYNMRAGKNGWDKSYGTAMEALNDAVQYVDPGLWDAIKSESGDSNENIKYGTFPMVGALTAVQEEVRGEQITPMQGAKLLSEIYQQGGSEALKTIYNPRTGNLYDKYIGQAKQYVFQKAAETSQDAQRATPQAETPPTAQNDVTDALNALNLFKEGNVAPADYDTQRRESLMFSEAPQEAVQNTDSFGAVTANDDFQNRDFNDVGNRKIKAYMYENPEVKPFFQLEAEAMLNDLKNSVKGERFYNSQLAYESGNEYGWTGNKRFVSDDIAVLLDYGYSYEEIEKGLKAIIEDDGRENNACSKRIEFLLNDRLMDGYTDWQSNEFVPPNQEYRNMILEKQINAYSKEAFEEYLKNAERYASQTASDEFNRQASATAQGQVENAEADAQFNELTQRYGAIPTGETPARDVQVPQRISADEAVGRTARTIMEAAATPDNRLGSVREAVVDGKFSYVEISNQELADSEAQRIERDGWQKSLTDWTAAVRQNQANENLAAMGAQLLNNAGNSDMSAEQYIDLATDYNRLMHNLGRGLAAGRILKTLTPEGKLYGIMRSIESLVDEANGKYNVEIDPALIDEYRAQTTDEGRDAVISKMQQNIANQIPSTWMDKFTSLRYTNMLGNFKTQTRNVGGNILMTLGRTVKDKLAAVIESAASAASVGQVERTKSLWAGTPLYGEAMRDFTNVEREAMGESKYSDSGREFDREVQERRTIFKNDGKWGTDEAKTGIGRSAIAKGARKVSDIGMAGMEAYRKATNWAMEQGDRIFVRINYADALAGWLKAHGISSIAEADAGTLDRARQYAIKQAQEATFRDTNSVSQFVSTFDKGWGKTGFGRGAQKVMQGIAPFRKTPANVAVRAEEYSPLGILNTAYKAFEAKRGKNDVTWSDVIDSAAKTLTGSGIYFLGYLMAAAGSARGKEEDEKKAAFENMQGLQDYSIILPNGKSISMNWVAPYSIPFFMGVLTQEAAADGGLSWDDAGKILGAVSDPMLEMSMLSGLNDALDNISKYNGDADALPQFLMNAFASYLSQGVTNTLLGQFEQASQETRQTTYTDSTLKIPTSLQYILGKASAKTPGVDYNQQDYIDAWGRKQSTGTAGERIINSFINPAYVNEDRSTPVDDELQRLYDAGQTNVLPQKASRSTKVNGERLSPEEYEAYSITKGQQSLELVQDFIESYAYKDMSDEARADVISDLYSFAASRAAKEIADGRKESYTSDWDDEAKLSDVVGYLATKSQIEDAQDGKDYTLLDALVDTVTEQQKSVQEKLNKDFSMLDELIYGKQHGVDAETIYTAKAEADANGNGKISQEELWFYLGLQKNMPEETKDVLWDILTTGKTGYSQYAEKQK